MQINKQNISKISVLTIATIFLSLADTKAADIKVFQRGKTQTVLSGDAPASLNRGTLAQNVVRFIESNKQFFGLQKVNGEVLELRKADLDEKGQSLRFIQRFNRVTIEGAEVVALADKGGQLAVLNSSLVPTPSITVQPSVSRKEALRIAIDEAGFKDAELGKGHNDGLLIVRGDKNPTLVWQFSLRERSTGENPMQLQVIANGPEARKVLKIIKLAHDLGGPISIYDASITLIIPNPIYKGVKVLEKGKETIPGFVLSSKEARSANKNFELVRSFYNDHFQRDSYDNRGAPIVASVNVQKFGVLDFLGQKQNAAWMDPWKFFAFGAGGDLLGGFAAALDVVGHEFTHAVISSTSNLIYEWQSGALNEHLADLFGAMIEYFYNKNTDKQFLIGDTVLRGKFKDKAEALRDMLHPSKGISPQPETVSEISSEFDSTCQPNGNNDNCGVHEINGPPNRAVAMIIEKLGWTKVAPIFYRVMTIRLLSNSTFTQYKEQVIDECASSLDEKACKLMEEKFAAVGI